MPRPPASRPRINKNKGYNRYPRKQTNRRRGQRQIVPVPRPPAPRRSTVFEPVGKYLGGMAGGFLGGPAGALLGSQLGSTAGSLISKVAGFGSYRVNKNTVFADTIPQFQNRMGDGSIRIKHKEFINDVISSSTPGLFDVNNYAISASDPTTFPYLSQLAVNFEEYSFEGLVFEYVTSCGSISSTGQLGTVVGATQFNSLALPYSNKQQMEASTFSQSTVASQSCIFPVECDALQTPSNGIFYNVRPGISLINNDKRWSQLGNFSLATVGMPNASQTVGELYVTYDVCLYKPILIQNTACLMGHWQSTAGIDGNHPFGTDATLTSGSDQFATVNATGDTITFAPSVFGNFQVSILSQGGAGAWAPPLPVSVNGVASFNIVFGNTTNFYTVLTDVGAIAVVQTFFFTVTPNIGIAPFVTFSGGTYFTATYTDLFVNQIPADIN